MCLSSSAKKTGHPAAPGLKFKAYFGFKLCRRKILLDPQMPARFEQRNTGQYIEIYPRLQPFSQWAKLVWHPDS